MKLDRARLLRVLRDAAIIALISWILLELLSVALFRIATGKPLDFAALHADRAGRLRWIGVKMGDGINPQITLQLHPYLGFIGRPTGSPYLWDNQPFNEWGVIGTDSARYPQDRRDDEFVIAIVGGSVAEEFAVTMERHLGEALVRVDPRFASRRVVVLNLALQGFKQPQQLFMVQQAWLSGFEFDAVVNLNGFNEMVLALENAEAGVNPLFPAVWHMGTLARTFTEGFDPSLMEGVIEIGTYYRRERFLLSMMQHAPWRWSPFLNLFADRFRRGSENRIWNLEGEIRKIGREHMPAEYRGPSLPAGADPVEVALRVWSEASRMLWTLCREREVVCLNLVQPNQYDEGSKPIGEEERRAAIDPSLALAEEVRAAYPRLREAAARLAADGVPVVDLTMMFKDNGEVLYRDTCCHLNGRGNILLTDAIAVELADAIREQEATRAHRVFFGTGE